MKSMKWFVAAALAVTMIIALGAKVSLAQEKCEGKIKAVDVDAKKVVCVKSCGMEVTCAIADDAKITLNGKEAKLADLKAGDKVSCECTKSGEAMTVKTLTATREEK